MKTLQAILLVLSVAISAGCKKSEKKATEPATPTTEKAPGAAAGKAPTDTVCCDFDGQVGAATRSQCEGGKGKVLDKKPPC